MEKSKVDMFIGLNAEDFNPHDLLIIKDKLEKMDDDLLKIIDLDQQIKTEIDSDFNIKEYSVFNLTKKVENLLNF